MSIKILLADDSITIQKVIGIIFGGDDYSLTIVDNGKAALEKAREVLPDVLLIDALMPGMTGYEVCEVIRSTPELAAKPILLLTGSFEPFDEGKAKTCGADDFLAKPFESQQIVAKVRELFEKGSSRSAAAQFQPAPEAEPFAAADEFFAPPPVDPFDTTASNEPAGETAPDDIWGAFTAAAEPAAPAPPLSDSAIAPQPEMPDVFALINEEQEMETAQPAVRQEAQEQTGSPWVPVEEHTFEFHGESAAEISGAAPSIAEVAFGEITFEEPAEPPAPPAAAASFSEMPIFEEPVSPPVEPFAPEFTTTEIPVSAQPEPAPAFAEPAAPAFAPAEPALAAPSTTVPTQLSEEQIKAAIAGLSKEVIERIVWEVVPDLAETLIKDAIRKIREGL